MIDLDKLEELAKTATTGLPGDRIQFSLAAWDPAAILELIAEVQALRETIKRQANAARAGMDAAKRGATILYAEAAKARAESSPEVLASERAMNAMLTEENEKLRTELNDFTTQCGKLNEEVVRLRAELATPLLTGADAPLYGGIFCAEGISHDAAESAFYAGAPVVSVYYGRRHVYTCLAEFYADNPKEQA